MATLKCRLCNKDVHLSDQNAGAHSTFESVFKAITGSTIYIVCEECDKKQTKERRSAEGLERIKESERNGFVRENFAKYLTPPENLIAKNPSHWAFAKTVKRRKGSIFCWGERGTGKSSFCRYILARLRWGHEGLTIGEVFAPTICESLWSFEKTQFLDALKKRHILLIDDISNARWNIQGLDCFRSIIDYRHEAGLLTLITSNKDVAETKQILSRAHDGTAYDSASLTDRFNPVTVLKFKGTTYRREI